MKSTRIVFMGSPDFALPTLSHLASLYNLVGVITQPDRPAGRGRKEQPCEVKKLADELGLPTFQPKSMKKAESIARLAEWEPELIVVAAFGQILPKAVLNMPKFGCLNVHASLLPAWRGASPIQAAIANGDQQSGVTIMLMNEGLDTGDILAQAQMPIKPGMTAGELSDKLAIQGAKTLVEILPDYLAGRIVPLPQDEENATYAPKLSKEDGLLDFNLPAHVLLNKINAYNPWPGAVYQWNEKRLKILSAHLGETENCEPGSRLIVDGLPAICTGDVILVLDHVQADGKKPLPGKTFLNGAKDWVAES